MSALQMGFCLVGPSGTAEEPHSQQALPWASRGRSRRNTPWRRIPGMKRPETGQNQAWRIREGPGGSGSLSIPHSSFFSFKW